MTEGREHWGNHCEFFLSSLGLAVGLGNVWRFPFICYENGGGTFLVPYVSMLLLVGLPIFFLELSIGQYGRVGANKVFGRMIPLFKGLGYAMIFVRFFVNIYYVVICAWCFFYLFAGFAKELPWGKCTLSEDCYSEKLAKECLNSEIYYKHECTTVQNYCEGHNLLYKPIHPKGCFTSNNIFQTSEELVAKYSISPAEDYFNANVLGISKNAQGNIYDWSNYGYPRWQLVLCLLLSWILICLILMKGLKTYGKVSYVITLSPYFVLTALLIYSVSLDGALYGIQYFFKADWSKLWSIRIWASAASQIFFSLSLGFGSQLVLSSYNQFNNNTHRDALLIGISNSLTSLYAGIVVFAILGFLDYQSPSSIEEVVKGGIALAFISYPSAVLEMAGSQVWSFLFFFMLINLALSSVTGGVQTILAFILDEKPGWEIHRSKIVICLCALFFVLGTSMCCNAGILLFTIFDKRCTSSLLFLTLIEVVMVAWIYGIEKFIGNLKEMSMSFSRPITWIWKSLWMIITPVLLLGIVSFSWIDHEPISYNDYAFPPITEIFGWLLELTPLAIVCFFIVYSIISALKDKSSVKEVRAHLFSSSHKWFEKQEENNNNNNKI